MLICNWTTCLLALGYRKASSTCSQSIENKFAQLCNEISLQKPSGCDQLLVATSWLQLHWLNWQLTHSPTSLSRNAIRPNFLLNSTHKCHIRRFHLWVSFWIMQSFQDKLLDPWKHSGIERRIHVRACMCRFACGWMHLGLDASGQLHLCQMRPGQNMPISIPIVLARDASSWMHPAEMHLHRHVRGCIFRFRYDGCICAEESS